jgi:hypothetical protein
LLADYTPPASQPARKIKTNDRDTQFAKLANRIDKLRARTVAAGFTPAEAREARTKVHDLLRSAYEQCPDTGLSRSELERFRIWYGKRG